MLADWLNWNNPTLGNMLATALVILIVLLMRSVGQRWVRNADIKSVELRRRWLAQIRNICTGTLLIALVIIWAAQLQSVMLSLAAIFVGLVIVTKELTVCFLGSIAKTGGSSFAIGDRIHIPSLNIRGDVIDQNLLTTKILEVGPGERVHQFSGRAVTIPNSVFVNQPVFNESFTEPWVLHVFTVPIQRSDDWQAAAQALLAAAQQTCSSYLEDAKRSIAQHGRQHGLDLPSAEPRVLLTLPEPNRIDLVVRVPLHSTTRSGDEQKIIRTFLENWRPAQAEGDVQAQPTKSSGDSDNLPQA
jgi:small-conductance mechanosensitive channel